MNQISTMNKLMKTIILFLLSALILEAHALPESVYQQIASNILRGETEVIMSNKTRCDILTPYNAIEVDFSKKWAESIGQSLNYAAQTGRKAGIVLIIDTPEDLDDYYKIVSTIEHHKLDIDVWTIDKERISLLLRHAAK